MATTENTPDIQAPAEPSQDGNGAAAPGPVNTGEPDTRQKLSELEVKHAEVADAYLRAKAESENTRRRAEE
ncbi:MAG TPA: nucleotide exchange factor GrpE, partial [Albitalea sp.]|nr:nucleotide exchange factor GrpE [Albitalea sp.]